MKKLWILTLLAAVVVAGCGDKSSSAGAGDTGTTGDSPSGGSVTITGAGSSFVDPAMQKWKFAYKDAHPGTEINYKAVGSGAGIAQLTAGTVDFAASDVAMSDKELGEMKEPVAQFPVIAGCVVVAYNIPGVEKNLKLSGELLAEIFLGKITKWNDAKIMAENAGLKLPDTAISVAHRSDGSGTSYIFTDYLSSESSEWSAGPGKGKSVEWPVGVGGKGSDGVAGLIKQSPGTIGYVELAYALQAGLTYGPIKNKSGKYIEATLESTSAAASAAAEALKADIRTSIVNTSAPDGYPIAGFTYAILPKAPKDMAKAKAMADFLKWILTDGQEMAKDLQYAPLPEAVSGVAQPILAEVKTQ